MSAATVIPLAILCVAAPIGVIDVAYFHVYRFRLYARRESRVETLTHLVRAAILCVAGWLLSRYEPHGAWFALLGGLFVLDLGNSVVDIVNEPRSRAALGGIPPLEYLIHMLGAMATGAAGATLLVLGWPLLGQPTALVRSELPMGLALSGGVLCAGALAAMMFEAALMIRAWRTPPGDGATSAGVSR